MIEKIEKDEWLTRIIEKNVYRLTIKNDNNTTHSDELIRLLKLQKQEVFLYIKIPILQTSSIKFIEELGFHLIDTNVQFEKFVNTIGNYNGKCEIRFASPQDEEETVEIGNSSFKFSRFHTDPQIPNNIADKIKCEWVRNYYRGVRGNKMVVASVEGKIAGFLQLIYSKEKIIIDLIAVKDKYQRIGIAKDMILFTEKKCIGFSTIEVGTQISNTPSIRMYESIGFKVKNANYVYHFHNKII